jgi:glycosyltransferase involved in cell wall biosynthesis
VKILYILPYVPLPPNSGNKNLTYGLLKYINQKAEFDVVMLADHDTMTQSVAEELMKSEFPCVGKVKVFHKPFGWRRLIKRIRYFIMGYHPALGNYANSEMWAWLQQATKDSAYDVVHFDMFHTAIYFGAVKNTACILIASDAYSMAAATARRHVKNFKESINIWMQEQLFKRIEKKIYPHFDAVCSVSSIDAKYLSQLSGNSSIHTVGIAISHEYAERSITHLDLMQDVEKKAKILVTGSLSHSVIAQGVMDFIKRTLPVLRSQYPSLAVTVLGKDATKELRTCLACQYGVEYIDFVEDYAAFLEHDWIYVYPQRCGSGLQTKVQQAMALGLPVVGYYVSFGGLEVRNGEHAFVCTGEEELERYVMELLSGREARIRIGKAASSHIRSVFSINRVGKQIMDIYQSLIERKRGDLTIHKPTA